MIKEIIINSSVTQNRVAITEDHKLVDFFVDHLDKKRMVGDIYLGRIARVLPGIRAAFIDIGMKHDAFLHFSDIGSTLDQLQSLLDEDYDSEPDEEEDFEQSSDKVGTSQQFKTSQITQKLKKGQDIIVQIIKEPVKGKGVRVSSSVSIPGRFCVLLPFDRKKGISKKISNFKERRRLQRIARSIVPSNFGIIIRTAAKGQSENIIAADLKYLLQTWEEIQEKLQNSKPPALIYKDVSTTLSVIRDFFTPDVNKVFIDSKKVYKEIRDYVRFMQPELLERIELYKGNEPIFEAFKIETQIREMFSKKVPLPSGGHIVIEQTEAMTVIDVNSGRYAAKREQELNSLKTDLEAAREIVRQLRLRDIGGLIVVDFIDLEDEKNRKKVYDELRKEFRRDRAKTAMLPMTDFGLMQITRQRIRENILQSTYEPCPYCNGTGWLVRKDNIIYDIEEWLKKYKLQGKEKRLKLVVHPSLGRKLREGRISTFTKFRFKYFFWMKLIEDEKMDPSSFKILSAKTDKDLTEEFS